MYFLLIYGMIYHRVRLKIASGRLHGVIDF